MICRLLLIIAITMFGGISQAADGSYVEQILKPKINVEEVTASADTKFEQALAESDEDKQKNLLNQARTMYYTLTNEDKGNIYAIVQLARIHDLQNNDKYARAYFSRALAINYKYLDANLYFGDYFYKRHQYKKALRLYRNAFDFGMTENPEMLNKMGVSYEKLGDLERANIYYKKLFLVNPQDENITNKIIEIETTKYKNTGYYSRKH